MATYQEWADAISNAQKKVWDAIDAVNSIRTLIPLTPYYPHYELDQVTNTLRQVETDIGKMVSPFE